mmetsp:Transcript_34534/g.111478  ORF Transcript_34534/g.111478 Transcript_34534/m.111478 type:complete len:99 (+) Transcript_34534:1626-1922(+)
MCLWDGRDSAPKLLAGLASASVQGLPTGSEPHGDASQFSGKGGLTSPMQPVPGGRLGLMAGGIAVRGAVDLDSGSPASCEAYVRGEGESELVIIAAWS